MVGAIVMAVFAVMAGRSFNVAVSVPAAVAICFVVAIAAHVHSTMPMILFVQLHILARVCFVMQEVGSVGTAA